MNNRKRWVRPLSTLLFIILPVSGHSQSPVFTEPQSATKKDTHSLIVHIGPTRTRDEDLGVFVHQGPAFGLDYSWRRHADNITEFGIKGAYTRLMHPLEFESESFSFESQIRFTKLKPLSHKQGLYIGGAAILFNEMSYYPYWDEQHYYWATSAQLAFSLRYELSGSNGLHAFVFRTPLLSLVSRPPERRLTVADEISFKGAVKSLFNDMELGTLTHHAGFLASYEYLFKWNARKIGVTAELSYHRIDTSRSQPVQRQRLLIGTRYIF